MKLFPFSNYKIHGHSMEPSLKEGQEVLSFNWAYIFIQPKVGDIVIFKQKSREFIKRIKKVQGCEIFVTGDNKTDSLDSRKFGWVNLDKVLGKVIWYY